MRLLRNATSRLVAAHLALVSLPTAGALGFVYLSAGGVVDGEMRQVVEAELRGLADDYARAGVEGLRRAIDLRLSGPAPGDAIYLLSDAAGARLAGNLARWPDAVAPGEGWTTLDLYRRGADKPTVVSAVALALPGGRRLLVGRDVAARAAFDRALTQALVWSALGVIALSLVTGWLLSRLVLSRIEGVAGAARRIMAGRAEERVAQRGTGDEFDRLAGVLNAMLDRNAALVADLRLTTDSIAHDLRGPLGRIRRALEAARDPALDPADRAARLDAAQAETDAVLAMSAAHLALSRIEAGIGAEQFAPVDLAAIARAVAELYEAAAEEAGMVLTCEAEAAAPAFGHPQLLAQALSNLVENALRHAAQGGAVAIRAHETLSGAALTVADRGPGVPPADRARVRERFTRLDPGRGGAGGAGLGLALVDAVARMHGGALTLGDARPGLIATLTLPREGAP